VAELHCSRPASISRAGAAHVSRWGHRRRGAYDVVAVLGKKIIEADVHPGQPFHDGVCDDVVPECVADAEVLVFVSKTQRDCADIVLTCPSIDMTVLDDVVAHLSFVMHEEDMFIPYCHLLPFKR